jgi:hypothetical protein
MVNISLIIGLKLRIQELLEIQRMCRKYGIYTSNLDSLINNAYAELVRAERDN